MTIDEHYQHCRSSIGDLSEHLIFLMQYAREAQTVLELGVRGIVSTWSFLAARPRRLVSIDLVRPSKHGGNLAEVYRLAREASIDFVFIEGDDRQLDLMGETFGLVFIDTLHTYNQMQAELDRYGPIALKYMILHDTVSYGKRGELGGKGILPAIEEYLDSHSEWAVVEHRKNCNGLMVLGRK